jgi:hypothetical protein
MVRGPIGILEEPGAFDPLAVWQAYRAALARLVKRDPSMHPQLQSADRMIAQIRQLDAAPARGTTPAS